MRCAYLIPALFLISVFGCAGQSFTFKKGVSLNHWTSYPIRGWSFADSKWFAEKDVEWIAKSGLDHIQLHVSGKEIMNRDGSLNRRKISPVDSLLKWTGKNKLGIIIALSELPDSKMDTALSKEEKSKFLLREHLALWDSLARYFKACKENVRFIVTDISLDTPHQADFYRDVVKVIRKSNAGRKIYLTISTQSLNETQIPSNDPGINISADMNVATTAENEALDIYLLQHMFRGRLPVITFPCTLPTFDSLRADHWARKYTGVRLDENYLNEKFKKVSRWMKANHPEKEFYLSHWRYFTGWPFNASTVKDEQSIRNFGKAFRKATHLNDINWCVYDYNSGSCIRYPDGRKALILEALDLE